MRGPALAALSASLLAACAGARVPTVGEPAPALKDEAAEKAYQETLERYTSRREIYRQLDTRAFAAATYQAPAFVEARVRRQGAFQAQPEALVEANLEKERAALEPFHEFFLAVHLNNTRFDDFDKKGSIWRLALVTPAGELVPAKIERVGRANVNLRATYPYFDDFWVGYRVAFPRSLESGQPSVPEGTTRLVLRMASTLGQADLEFPAR